MNRYPAPILHVGRTRRTISSKTDARSAAATGATSGLGVGAHTKSSVKPNPPALPSGRTLTASTLPAATSNSRIGNPAPIDASTFAAASASTTTRIRTGSTSVNDTSRVNLDAARASSVGEAGSLSANTYSLADGPTAAVTASRMLACRATCTQSSPLPVSALRAIRDPDVVHHATGSPCSGPIVATPATRSTATRTGSTPATHPSNSLPSGRSTNTNAVVEPSPRSSNSAFADDSARPQPASATLTTATAIQRHLDDTFSMFAAIGRHAAAAPTPATPDRKPRPRKAS